jgi:cobalt-zinc-cadmium efflux system outer membrane protein
MKNTLVCAALSWLSLVCAWPGGAFAQAGLNYEALTLAAAEAALLERNRDIRLARRAVDQAKADVLVAGQKPNPQLSWLTQNINRSRGIGAGSLRDKTVDNIVGLSQTFERGDKAALRVATAQRLEEGAGSDLVEVARTQLFTFRSAYFDLLAAQERLDGARESAALYEKTLQAANLRLKAGDLAGADVARINVEALRAQNDAGAAQADVVRARVVLANLLGDESKAPQIRAVSPWPAPEAVAGSAAIDDLVAARPDVRAAMARVQAADRARDLAQALRTRDVTVGAQFEHYPVNDTNQSGSGNSFGVGISVPLFLRHSYEGEIARAQADWYAARDQLERVKALAVTDIMRSRGDLEASRERLWRFENDLLPKAARGAEAAEFAFRNGAIGVMDLLDARRTLKALQLEAANARADHARARAAWRANIEPPPVLAAGESR